MTTGSSAAPDWVPACGGTETPFTTRIGHRLLYMWNSSTGEHAYYDVVNDSLCPTTKPASHWQ